MIRLGFNVFMPGSEIPMRKWDRNEDILVRSYLDSGAWEQGRGVLLLGEPSSGKTTLGMHILRRISEVSPLEMIYWTEYDFLADLRNLWRLEEMTQKATRDDALWGDYLEWERSFWDLKEAPFLFLDDAGRGYTPFQNYEVENLLRLRETKAMPTIVASQTGLWENIPAGLRSVVERNSITIKC